MTQNMTRGNPLKLIILFSLPMLVGNLFQQLYNMADTFIVGRTIGMNALAAVGSTGSINFLIVGFAAGATAGMAIVTAQRYGAGDMDGVRRSFAASVILTALITAILTVISVGWAGDILRLMQTPEEIFEDAKLYMLIISWFIFATMIFNLMSNFMRAVGNSRTPLVYLVVASILNIILDYALIKGLGMGVEGAAFATVTSQLVAGLLCVRYIMRSSSFRMHKEDWKVTSKDIWEHLRVGLPMGFQASIIAVGTIVLQYALNGLGTTSMAAFTAANKIDGIATLPLMSLGVAMATYVAQNFGAKDVGRIRKGVRQCAIVSGVLAVVMGAVNIFLGKYLAGMFLVGNPEATGLAHTYLIINGFSYVFLALLFVFRYSLQGLGSSLAPTIAGVMELVMRCIAGIFLAASFGYVGACLASPLAWAGAAVPLAVAMVYTLRRLGHKPEMQADAQLCVAAE